MADGNRAALPCTLAFQLLGSKGCPVDAVPPRPAAENYNGVAGPGGQTPGQGIFFHEAHTHDIHQGVSTISRGKFQLSPDGGNAEDIAVVGSTGDDTFHQLLHPFVGRVAEAEGIEEGNGAGTHGQNIPDNAAHACSCTIVGFNGRGMIVALYFKGNGQAVADIDHAGILPRTLEDPLPLGGKTAQKGFGIFITTVFRPHDTEDTQLYLIGFPPEQRYNFLIFPLT